jgi:hypothetical protein
MEVLLKIPVHSRVKKFIEFSHPETPLRLNTVSLVGSLLISLLNRNQNMMPDKYKTDYPELLQVIVPERWVKYRGKDLTPFSVFVFNHTIDSLMRENLFTSLYMFHVMDKNVIKREAIITYLRLHGITEDDLPYDTIIRDYNRFVKRKQHRSKIFGSTLSPRQFPGMHNKLLYV